MDRVRQDLQRIIAEARGDSGSTIVAENESFPYDSFMGDLDLVMNMVKEVESETIKALGKIRNSISQTSLFTNQLFSSFLAAENEIETKLLDVVQFVSAEFQKLCSQLYIDARDLYSPSALRKANVPTLHRIKNQETVKKKGILAAFRRIFGSQSGYEVKTTYSTDHATARKELLEYHDGEKSVLIGFINAWKSRVAFVRERIDEEISRRKKADEERITRALVAQSYIDVANQLSVLISQMPERPKKSNYLTETRVLKPKEELFQIEVNKAIHELYSLSLGIKKYIQEIVVENCFGDDGRILVIGGDISTEVFFLTQILNESIDEENIREGRNIVSDRVLLWHKYNIPEKVLLEGNSSVFILFNGTQIGSAERYLYSISECVKDRSDIRLFWVVQDFQEVINAQDIEGCLCELKCFAEDSFPELNIKFLLVHENPLYNLALSAIQEKDSLSQTDSVEVINDLGLVSYLEEYQSKDIIHDILKAFA